MCCSVLQCVAVLQCAAVCCSMLQYVAACCSVLRCVTVCCCILQCHFAIHIFMPFLKKSQVRCVADSCRVSQYLAVCRKCVAVVQLLSVSVFHCLTVCLLYKRSDSVPQKGHWCNVMQIDAACCGVLQCAGGAFQFCAAFQCFGVLQYVAVSLCYSSGSKEFRENIYSTTTLQHKATYGNTLPHTTPHCETLRNGVRTFRIPRKFSWL